MDTLTSAIRRSIEQQNWHAALALALVLPDICGKLQEPDAKSKDRYISWFDANLATINKSVMQGQEFVFMSAMDCYFLRCAYLHAGGEDVSEERLRDTLNHFYFTTANQHRIRVDDTLTLNVGRFCEEMCQAVDKWWRVHSSDQMILKRQALLLQIRTKPFSPKPGIKLGGKS